jgi:hypothetical protein
MKRAVWSVLVIVVVSAVAYAVYSAVTPATESDKIRKQYNRHLQSRDESKFPQDNINRSIYEKLSKEFQVSLALAYNREKKPDEAIVLIEELIKQNDEPPFRLFGRLMPRGSWVYGFDANYYEMLANAFELKKDNDSRDNALKKKDQARAEEKRLIAIEKSYGNKN